MVIGTAKTTLAHYRMKMSTSQTGRDMDTAEMFNAFFASNFNMDDGPRGSQCPELEDSDCNNDQFHSTPKPSRICFPSCIPTNLWNLMGIIQESSKS